MRFWCVVIVATAGFYSMVLDKEIQAMHQDAWQQSIQAQAISTPALIASR